MEKKLKMSQILIQKIVNYLQMRPYSEVHSLIADILTEANAKEQENGNNEQCEIVE